MDSYLELLKRMETSMIIAPVALVISFISLVFNVKIQKQDLFKLRFALYLRIIEAFQDATECKNSNESIDKTPHDFFEKKYHHLLFESRCLFGNKVEKTLRLKLSGNIISINGINIHRVSNKEGTRINYRWIPNDKFNALFTPYLESKSLFRNCIEFLFSCCRSVALPFSCFKHKLSKRRLE